MTHAETLREFYQDETGFQVAHFLEQAAPHTYRRYRVEDVEFTYNAEATIYVDDEHTIHVMKLAYTPMVYITTEINGRETATRQLNLSVLEDCKEAVKFTTKWIDRYI